MMAAGGKVIGLDFDNTIVSYEKVYRSLAHSHGVTVNTGLSAKNALRDHLKKLGREAEFTRLQGEVYGPGMRQAEPYPGFTEFCKAATGRGWEILVISHRTRRPLAGTAHDLHQAARDWMDDLGFGAFGIREAHFEETKEAKVARIRSAGCRVFIDDLPEILSHPEFPAECGRFLFAAGVGDPDPRRDYPAGGWKEAAIWLTENNQ